MDKSLTEQMQEKITDGLEGAFDSVIESRRAYYEKNPGKVPGPAAVDALIRSVCTQNAAISGGAGLVPGPFGMLAVVPELLLVINNQIKLIYDIGVAQGKGEKISRELLVGIFITAAGAGAGGLLVMHGGKVLVRRASLRVMQRIIALLGGRITQQALKSAVSKWLPGVGAAAMAVWTGYLTKQIGQRASEVFKKDIVDETELLDVAEDLSTSAASAASLEKDEEGDALEFCKLQVLIDLAKIDGRIDDEERRFIESALESAELTPAQREQLGASLAGKSQDLRGLDALAAKPDSAIALLSNMVVLAKKDGDFHVTERLYIKRVSELLGFRPEEVEELAALE